MHAHADGGTIGVRRAMLTKRSAGLLRLASPSPARTVLQQHVAAYVRPFSHVMSGSSQVLASTRAASGHGGGSLLIARRRSPPMLALLKGASGQGALIGRTSLLCTSTGASGSHSSSSSSSSSKGSSSGGDDAAKLEKAATAPAPAKWTPQWMWNATKETVKHYYHGSKLLAADTRIAAQLVRRMMVRKSLTRREHNLLVRVCADIARLVPLSFFVLVPMMEFALPFAIKLFPNLLPSTFEEKHQRDERKQQLLKERLEMAKVLESTLEARAAQVTKEKKSARQLRQLLPKRPAAATGSEPSPVVSRDVAAAAPAASASPGTGEAMWTTRYQRTCVIS